jgi:hypothetical protein
MCASSESITQWGVECVANQTEMIEYALKNDPLPMHIDEQAARTSPYGALIASSGFTISLWFRSSIPIARWIVDSCARRARMALHAAASGIRGKSTSKQVDGCPQATIQQAGARSRNDDEARIAERARRTRPRVRRVILVATKPG